MKLYRTVLQKELEDIEMYNRIRFQNPFWNFKSEGKIVNIFREINDLSKKEKNKDKIRKWVQAYIESHRLKGLYLKSEKKWYDLFTELSQLIYLFFTYYCKSFCRTKKEITVNKNEENVAIIEIDFDNNIILKCEDDENKIYNLIPDKRGYADAYIRYREMKYSNVCNYNIIFEEFNEERILSELLSTISSKYEWQEEERVFININTHRNMAKSALSSFGQFLNLKYNGKDDILKIHNQKESNEYYEDFIEALYKQFQLTYKEVTKTLPKNIYLYFPKNNIEITKL